MFFFIVSLEFRVNVSASIWFIHSLTKGSLRVHICSQRWSTLRIISLSRFKFYRLVEHAFEIDYCSEKKPLKQNLTETSCFRFPLPSFIASPSLPRNHGEEILEISKSIKWIKRIFNFFFLSQFTNGILNWGGRGGGNFF